MPNIVEILITATNEAGKAFAETEASGTKMQKTLSNVGLLITAGLVATAAAAVKMASDYDMSVTRLGTSAGESQKNIGMVSQGMLDMASKVGTSAEDLSKGMYVVESAGYHGADGLNVLKAAAQGAKDENASLGDVANGVTDILKDYHLGASQAANVTSQMVTAVSYGKTNFEAFSKAMANIVPVASAVHLSFADVSGVLAQMTSSGFTAQRASQNIAQAIRSLVAPTKTMKAAFSEVGISAEDVQKHLGKDGLSGTMEWLSGIAKQYAHGTGPEYAAEMRRLMGTAPGMVVALTTTGENAKKTSEAIAGISKSTADAHGNVIGFAEVQKQLAFQLSQIKAEVITLAIELGHKLIPAIQGTFGFIADHSTVFKDFAKAIALIAGAIGVYTLAVKGAELATKAWAIVQAILDGELVANPIGLIAVAIVGLVAGFMYLWNHFEGFRNFWKAAWADIQIVFSAAWDAIVSGAKAAWAFLQPVFDAIVKLAKQVMTDISDWWKSHSAEIEAVLKAVWDTIQKDFQIAWDYISKQAKAVWTDLQQWWKEHGEQVKAILSLLWTDIKATVQATWPVITTIIRLAWELITSIIKAAVDPIKSILQGAWDIISGAVRLVWAVISNVIKMAFDTIMVIVNVGLDLLTGNWKKAWNDFKAYLAQTWDAVKSLVSSGISALGSILSGAVKIISGIWGALESILTAPFRAAWGAISGIIHSISSSVSSAVSSAKSSLSAVGLAHGGISGAASGGARSDLTMVGEYGRELVKLPAGSRVYSNPDTESMLQGGGGGGGVTHIVIESDGTSYSEFLVRELKNLARVRGGGNLQLAVVGRSA